MEILTKKSYNKYTMLTFIMRGSLWSYLSWVEQSPASSNTSTRVTVSIWPWSRRKSKPKLELLNRQYQNQTDRLRSKYLRQCLKKLKCKLTTTTTTTTIINRPKGRHLLASINQPLKTCFQWMPSKTTIKWIIETRLRRVWMIARKISRKVSF